MEPCSGEAVLAQARQLMQLGKYAQAQKAFSEALILLPPCADLTAELAMAYELDGDLAEAAKWSERALELPGSLEYAHYQMARVRTLQNRFAQAHQHIQQALQLAPYESRNHVVLARLHALEQNFSKASEVAKLALEHDPENQELQLVQTIVSTYSHPQGQVDPTAASREAIRLMPESADAHCFEGWTQVRLQPREAEAAFRRALALNPHSAPARRGLMLALRGRQRWEVLSLSAWKDPMAQLAPLLSLTALCCLALFAVPGTVQLSWWLALPYGYLVLRGILLTCRAQGNLYLLCTRHRSLLYPSEILVAKLWGVIALSVVVGWVVLEWRLAAALTAWSSLATIALCTVDVIWERVNPLGLKVSIATLALGWAGCLFMDSSLVALAWICWLAAGAVVFSGMMALEPHLELARMRPSFGRSGHLKT